LVENPGGQLRPAFATHDMTLIGRIRQSAVAGGVSSQAYQIQMLYGIESGAQERLVDDGVRVMVLISYGTAWYPWYVRRLAERPANVWFVVRSTFR
jgi:proline dehydrogenase